MPHAVQSRPPRGLRASFREAELASAVRNAEERAALRRFEATLLLTSLAPTVHRAKCRAALC